MMGATVTRNHRCQTLEELLSELYQWLAAEGSFYTRTLATYAQAA